MNVRRSLATLLSVGSLLLAGACAGDDLESNPDAEGSQPADTLGEVVLAGQSFPEATLVAEMYKQLLANAGYEPVVKLVDSRDGYMPTFPDSVDIVPEYVGGIVNFLNAQANGDDAKPFEAGDGTKLADDGADLLGRCRYHPARPLRGHRHQRLLS